jgi:hypothetical protein
VVKVSIDGIVRAAQPDELLVDLIDRTGGSIPQVCYHPSAFSDYPPGMARGCRPGNSRRDSSGNGRARPTG